jgi:hypothetical protein
VNAIQGSEMGKRQENKAFSARISFQRSQDFTAFITVYQEFL